MTCVSLRCADSAQVVALLQAEHGHGCGGFSAKQVDMTMQLCELQGGKSRTMLSSKRRRHHSQSELAAAYTPDAATGSQDEKRGRRDRPLPRPYGAKQLLEGAMPLTKLASTFLPLQNHSRVCACAPPPPPAPFCHTLQASQQVPGHAAKVISLACYCKALFTINRSLTHSLAPTICLCP